MISLVRGKSSALREALGALIAFVSFAQMSGSDVGEESAGARELLAACLAGELLRSVRRLQVLLQRALLGEVASAELARLSLDDALVNAFHVVLEAAPLEVGGVAKLASKPSPLMKRRLVIMERWHRGILFAANVALEDLFVTALVRISLMTP